MRLIDADELKKEMQDRYNGEMQEACFSPNDFIIDWLNEAPTIDQWHYPSRGEYPTEGETVIVAFQEGGPWYFTDAEYHEGGWASAVDLGHIIAWQYIIPPKEEA